jgi:hypothetical protein
LKACFHKQNKKLNPQMSEAHEGFFF